MTKMKNRGGKKEAYRNDWIGLGEMAAVLNHEYNLDPKIARLTPYDWWRREKSNTMPVKMPPLVGRFGRSPAWHRGDIIDWYGKWKGLTPDYMKTKEELEKEASDGN